MAKKPALAPEMVQEFVNEAHGNFGRVKELLAQETALLNAAWDWGGGDWETGLGAAAHMGKKDIALYLLAHGARIDIFAAAMLGRLEIVRAILSEQPEALRAPGPHGISLLSHARKGGKAAAAVVALLQELGDSP
ncbi:MAG TPA: hypothetical protein PKC19_15650 [Roseiflexaceae bacterium]|nr:hypothetical protein [Roseiflexaceae bacterium]